MQVHTRPWSARLLVALSCLVAVSALLPAQVLPVLTEVSFRNETGAPQDGLTLTFSQPLEPNQPMLVPGGGTIIPPFTLPAGYPTPDVVVLNGQTVAPGARVPTNGTMSFTGSVVDSGVAIDQATWTTAGVPTRTVALVSFLNMTGSFANRVAFTIIGESGAVLVASSVSIADSYAPNSCTPTGITPAGGSVIVDVPCCVSGFGGVIGPLQITLPTAERIAEVRYSLIQNGTKRGSALDKVVRNLDQEESGGPQQNAGSISIQTNLPVDAVFPPSLSPFALLSGLNSSFLYACDGTVPPGASLQTGRIVLTSIGSGTTNLGTSANSILWYAEPSLFGAVPDLFYLPFDATAGNGTPNVAEPGVGADPVPIQGHSSGQAPGQFGTSLQGAGSTSASNFLETGWVPDLGLDDFTVSFWVDRNNVNTQTSSIFGAPDSISCRVTGADVELRMVAPGASEIVRVSGVLPAAGGQVGTFVRDSTVDEVRAYVDGNLVLIQPVVPVPLLGVEECLIGAVAGQPALESGVRLDELRLYRRALSPMEVSYAYDKSLPSIVVITNIPQWGSNDLDARFEADGVGGLPGQPVILTRCVGETVSVSLSSQNQGMGWEFIWSDGAPPIQPRSLVNIAVGDQPVNLDIYDPGVMALNGFQFQSPFFNAVIPFTPSSPNAVNAQLAVASPSLPFGIATSAAGTIQFTTTGSQAVIDGPDTDDGFVEVFPGSQPLCGPLNINFAGTAYTSAFVNANGSVSFGAPAMDPSPTAMEFASGPPRLAGLWTDLDPSAEGDITMRVVQGALLVRFGLVGVSGTQSEASFDLVFSANGACGVFGYDPPGAAFDTLVGLTPGGGASDPGSLNLGALVGAGLQTGSATDMVYEVLSGSAPSGFYSIEFLTSDGSAYIVE